MPAGGPSHRVPPRTPALQRFGHPAPRVSYISGPKGSGTPAVQEDEQAKGKKSSAQHVPPLRLKPGVPSAEKATVRPARSTHEF